MSVRSASVLPIFALLCAGAVVIGVPVLRASRTTAAVSAPQIRFDEDPSEFPPHGHGAIDRTASAAATSASPARPESRESGALDPAQIRARIEADIAVLDARFAAEPLDTAWAMREERALQAFFSADALRAQQLPSPSGLQTICHSATCRVSARFADPIEAEATTQRLAMHLAARLPYGAIMPRAMADGSVQVDAWYSSQRIAL